MNLKFKLMVILMVTIFMLCAFWVSSYAGTVPEKIRVGVLFDYPKTGVSKSADWVGISSEKGTTLTLKSGENTIFIQNFSENELVSIYRDSYYKLEAGKMSQVGVSYQGNETLIGPYHVKIGLSFASLDEVNNYIDQKSNETLSIFPAWAGGKWEAWIGTYFTKSQAEDDINKNIQNIIKEITLDVIEPNIKRTVISKDQNVLLISDDYNNTIRVSSMGQESKGEKILKVISTSEKLYRGDIEVKRFESSDMTVINEVSMQDYLYGVVPYEVGAYAHIEAMKAQAVTARTYALNSMGKHNDLEFDICDTVHCQVYGGFKGETVKSNQSVNETKDQIVKYEGKPALVFYFSSSGGRTEDVQYVWGSNYPYLKSVEDKYETGKTANYNWTTSLKSSDIKERMNKRGYNLGDILDLKITERAPSGRVVTLQVIGKNGTKEFKRESSRTVFSLSSQQYDITTSSDVTVLYANEKVLGRLGGKKVVSATGESTIANTGNLKVLSANGVSRSVTSIPNEYTIKGKGWGHAVGMSQDGAHGMGLAGYKYTEILEHYFVGTNVE